MTHVDPVFKKEDKSCADNYRLVSITSITSNLAVHILHSSIMTHLDNNRILTNAQHGFRRKRSSETQQTPTIPELEFLKEK